MNKPIVETSPPTLTEGKLRRNVTRGLLACLLLFGCGILLTTGGKLAPLQSWLNQAGMGAPVLFVLVAIVLMSVIMPKTFVSISAGALFGTTRGAFLVTIIAVSAALINYFIGRWCLSQWIDRRLNQNTAERAKWPKVLRDLASEGNLGFHLLFRFAPIPSMIVNYSMGAANARLAPFLTGALVGVLPQLLWVHGGTLAQINQPADIGNWRLASTAVSILAAIAVSILLPRQVMRRIEKESNGKESTNTG
ncbi:MAG: VTT domain-containing protein [Pirellulaceae bacterium]